MASPNEKWPRATSDRPSIALLGASDPDYPVFERPELLPVDARVVVFDCRGLDSGVTLAAARARAPAAACIALVGPERVGDIDALLRSGFDDVALSRTHLAHCAGRIIHEQELREAYAAASVVHDGLVALIGAIALRPGLQEVLQTAVLHMSELFKVDRVSMVLFDRGSEVGFVVMEREQALLDNIVVRIADYPELQQIIATKQPLVISDVFGDALMEGVRKKLTTAEQPHRSAVLFPLLRRDQVVGALFLRNKSSMGSVTERLLAMGRLVASVTAVAIGHAIERDTLLSEHRALERSKAHALEQLEGLREMREFLDQAKDGMVVTDSTGVIRYANAAAGAILRTTLTDLPSKRFVDLLVPQYHGVAAGG
jgi:PAS domain-containing protein